MKKSPAAEDTTTERVEEAMRSLAEAWLGWPLAHWFLMFLHPGENCDSVCACVL